MLPVAIADSIEDSKLMLRCAQLFYRSQKQQQEIARQLGLSASRVSRLLRKALEEGIVEIQINPPRLAQLSIDLAKAYGLRDAVVIPAGEQSERKQDLGIAAARYFEHVVGEQARVGLSCGMTLYYFVKYLSEGAGKRLTIVPLAAENSPSSVTLSPNTLVGLMALKFQPDVTAYALVGDLTPGHGMEAETHKVYQQANDVDVAIFGIGALDPAVPGFCRLASLYGVAPDRLSSLGVVGEINYQPLDSGGDVVDASDFAGISRRVLAVPVSRLAALGRQHGKLVIALSGGPEKVPAIRAALKASLCNVLITDQEAAVALLAAHRQGE